jgi:hypothetical protein
MDLSLTLRKIETIENKLKNKRQLERNPQDREELERQLDSLKVKLRQSIEGPSTISDSATAVAVPSKQYTTNGVITAPMQESRIISELTPLDGISATIDATPPTSKPKRPKPDVPLNGFDETDLKLYLPVAENIETTMPNATIHEKLAAFRAVPSLREHFQEKVRRTFVEPMEDLKKLEDLRNRYLYSSSSVEKTQIKRELDQLERTIQDENVYTYSESVYLDLPPLLEDELQARVEAISSLPPTLQALYKRAQNLKVEDELQLAIMMDYYENQMQLLEQLQKYAPLCSELLDETRQAIESLPRKLQDYLALQLGLDEGYSIQALVKALENGGYDGTDAAWTDLRNTIFEAASETTLPDLPEYRDIDFIDRSRYVEEFYPCVARMEGQHPTQKQVDAFIGKLGRKTFMVTSKPERVLGGWYVRGENLLSEDERGAKLVSAIEKRIDGELKERLEFFYLPDPAPLSDELIEMGYVSQQLILVTSRNETAFYNYGAPVTKGVVSALGMLSLFMFSGVVSELQPTVREQVDATLVNGGDLSWFADSSLQIVGACLVIQAAHELAHRFVAKRDRFDIGLPTSIPSIQLGLLGSVTPIKSPPPSLISMFDFALAGPIAGLGVSMIFLLYGLQVTASMSASELAQLPALPVELVRSSALAGGLVEEVLGKATLFGSATTAGSILPLHPLAISGFVGVVSNALALLPLGSTSLCVLNFVMHRQSHCTTLKLVSFHFNRYRRGTNQCGDFRQEVCLHRQWIHGNDIVPCWCLRSGRFKHSIGVHFVQFDMAKRTGRAGQK